MLIRNTALLKIVYFVLAACTASVYPSPGSYPKPTHDVAITNVSVPSSCAAGDTIPVIISIANQGAQRETFRITLMDDVTEKEIASREMTLARGWNDGFEGIADIVFDAEGSGIQHFGDGIWSRGDVNGDGLDDVLICAPRWNSNRGRAYLYYGGNNIDPSCPDVTFSGEDPNTYLGNYAGISTSDINRDGYEDVIIGARGYHDYDGRVYVYCGGPAMDTQADMVFEGEKGKESWFGLAVASSDIDHDGYEDIIVGAQMYDQGRGRVYLFWGGESMDTIADVVFEGEDYPGGKPVIDYGTHMVQGLFGRKLDAGGDVNGDGYNDILVGARHAPDHNYNGSAYLFIGNTKQKMDSVSDYVFRGEDARDQMGSSLELFDIDNNGFADVIVGARGARNWRGAVYIWWGVKAFDGSHPDMVLEGEPGSNMGGDEIVCGYFNDDLYGDILAGAYNYPGADTRRGRAYVFYGNKQSSMDTSWDHVFEGENASCYQYFGISTVPLKINIFSIKLITIKT